MNIEPQKRLFTLGAFGMIFDESGRVLLIHRNDRDVWGLPGGGIEYGEKTNETIMREIKEETGYEVTVRGFQKIYVKETDLVFIFVCDMLSGQSTFNDEVRDIQFFNKDNIPLNINHNHLRCILDF